MLYLSSKSANEVCFVGSRAKEAGLAGGELPVSISVVEIEHHLHQSDILFLHVNRVW